VHYSISLLLFVKGVTMGRLAILRLVLYPSTYILLLAL
jgi:hypothetical protein